MRNLYSFVFTASVFHNILLLKIMTFTLNVHSTHISITTIMRCI
jgi:hypothetical protein